MFLLSCAEQLKWRRVKVFTDNQGAARIVSVGSSKVHLELVAVSIFLFLSFKWDLPRSVVDPQVAEQES